MGSTRRGRPGDLVGLEGALDLEGDEWGVASAEGVDGGMGAVKGAEEDGSCLMGS